LACTEESNPNTTKANNTGTKWQKAQNKPKSNDNLNRELLIGLCVRVYISLCTNDVHNTVQKSSDNLPSGPPCNHHSSNDVYCRRQGICQSLNLRKRYRPTTWMV